MTIRSSDGRTERSERRLNDRQANHVRVDAADESAPGVKRRRGIERLQDQIPRALPRHRTGFGHRLAQARTVDQVGDQVDAAIVLAKVADLQQAWMRHLQRARFEEESRAHGIPMRLFVALQHADRDRNTKGAMRSLVNQAAQPAAGQHAPQFVSRQQAGITG